MTHTPTQPARRARGLGTRDFVNVGVFTAVYLVVFFALGVLGLVNPMMVFVGQAVAFVANGVVISLFLARVPKFGALALLGVVISLFMVVAGQYSFMLFVGVSTALLGDLVARSGNYRAPVPISLGYAVFSMWNIGPLLPIFFDTAGYRELLETSWSVDYANSFMALVTPTAIVVWAVIAFALSFVGGLLGQRVLGRHFRRAGLAR
ncbi:MAG: permease [Actinomycetales bacterium]|nr:MAG: permease [Actinomycetales bacterium]